MISKKEWTISDIVKGRIDAKALRLIAHNTGKEVVGFSWLDYPSKKTKRQRLLALSKSVGGKVLVQPQNCTISLRAFSSLKEIYNKYRATGGQPPTSFKEEMINEGLAHGIKYVDFPSK